MKRALSILLAIGLLTSFALIAAADEPLIIGTTDRVTQLAFANSYDHYSWHVLRATTDALMRLNEETLDLEGAIAESWDVSADGMVYTFHIRPGITFWDGEKCDAAAVKWSLDRTLRLDGPEGGVGLIKPYIDKIEVIDPLTVKITLTMPDAIFLLRMTDQISPAMIYSPKSTPADEFANGVYAGTGPYKLIEHVPDQYVKYEAYDKYYGAAPKTKLVIEKLYSDAAALRAAIEAGDVDMVFRTLSPQDIKDLESNPNVNVTFYPPSPGIRYLLFNVTQPPVDDPLVRQAICYAVDRGAIVDQVFSGTVDPIYTMVPMVDPPFYGAINVFPERDLDKAVELLAKAGYTKDNPLKVNLWYTPKHYGTTEADVATVIAGSLEETGVIKITIQVLEWGAYTERMSSGGFDMFLLGWHPDYLESSNFLAPWTTEAPEGLGTFFNHHPNYEAYKHIMEVATTTVDPVKRAKLYKAIQILSVQDVPWIPLWAMTDEMVVATRPGVHGATLDITMDIHIWNIYKD
jgi:peptide/nickel transport system substrate-binding protein